jgi:hypothetical protein
MNETTSRHFVHHLAYVYLPPLSSDVSMSGPHISMRCSSRSLESAEEGSPGSTTCSSSPSTWARRAMRSPPPLGLLRLHDRRDFCTCCGRTAKWYRRQRQHERMNGCGRSLGHRLNPLSPEPVPMRHPGACTRNRTACYGTYSSGHWVGGGYGKWNSISKMTKTALAPLSRFRKE